jgi:hypothetical protein
LTVDGKQLYTWCAPDTLIFPAVIGRTAGKSGPMRYPFRFVGVENKM